MFKIGQLVYHVNGRGYTSLSLYEIINITSSLVILDASFLSKRGTLRKFEIRIDKYLANKVLFYNIKDAINFSIERTLLINSGQFPYSVGDKISWRNKKYVGVISNITDHSYIVYTDKRKWSLDPFSLDIVRIC